MMAFREYVLLISSLLIVCLVACSSGEVVNRHELIEIVAELTSKECDELIDALHAHSFDWTKHPLDQTQDQIDPLPACLDRLEHWAKGDTGSWSYLFLGLQEIERPELAQRFAQEVSADVISRLRSIPSSGIRLRKKRKIL